MTTRNFQSSDMISTAGLILKVSKQQAMGVSTKPTVETITVDNSAAPVPVGSTSISVTALTAEIPKNTELDFGGTLVTTTSVSAVAATSIDVKPTTAEIADAATAEWDQLSSVLSLNQADTSLTETSTQDRNFLSGTWTSTRIFSRSSQLTCNGVKIKDDPGLANIREASKGTGRVYFELIEPVSGEIGDAGWAYATGFTINRAVDAHEEVSFNLDVDGELLDLVAA